MERRASVKARIADVLETKPFRVRVTGVVVSAGETDSFLSITLDDSTGTIRCRDFDKKVLAGVEVGDIVEVIGRTREYGGETYILPEIVLRHRDPNILLLRLLETIPERDNDLKARILKFVKERGGAKYSEIVSALGAEENEVDVAVQELLDEGSCFEPSPGFIKAVE